MERRKQRERGAEFLNREAQTRWAEGRSSKAREGRSKEEGERTDLRLIELVFADDLDCDLKTGLLVDSIVDV